MEQIVLSWSGGKDSAIALKRLLDAEVYEVVGLLTAFSGIQKKVSLHHTHYDLIKAQADAIGIPLIPIYLSENAKNEEYEKKHMEQFKELKEQHVFKIAFGDIHLQPIREYRDQMLQKVGVQGVYPIWENDTHQLMREFINAGFKAVTTAIDKIEMDDEYLEREIDNQFLQDIPNEIDPCGENGEYHSFVYNGPYFKHPLQVKFNHVFEADFRPKIEMKLKIGQMTLV